MAFPLLEEGSAGSVFTILISPLRSTETVGRTAEGEARSVKGGMGGDGGNDGGEPPLG
jgi:hypothetical protein